MADTINTNVISEQNNIKRPKRKGSLYYISGGISGAFASVVSQPFDVIKTNMIGLREANKNIAATRTSMIQTGILIFRDEGIKGLYRGTVPTVWRVTPGAALNYGLLYEIKRQITIIPEKFRNEAIENLIVGGTARGVATTIFNPITVVKTRFEVAPITPEQKSFSKGGMISTLKHIYKTEGLRKGLFSGLVPTLVRDVPYAGVFFYFYNKSNNFLIPIYAPSAVRAGGQITNTSGTPGWITFVSSGTAAFVGSFLTYPFDVVRTRLQLKANYSGIWNAIVTILKEEGPSTFLRGLLPRLLKRTVASSISWYVLEQGVNQIEKLTKK